MEEPSRRRLASQIAQGRAILFTGAGFSRAARNRLGTPLPLSSDLAKALWAVAFPGQPFETGSALGEVFEVARRRGQTQVRNLPEQQLRTDRDSLPDGYRVWLSLPWLRAYTLNMDDLDEAVQAKFNLRRQVRVVSAFRHELPSAANHLISIHLNGRISDFTDVTFSPVQYAERSLFADPWYQFLVSDLVSHPIVFVGASMNEPLLWEHLEIRRARTRGARELRPRSYLVMANLSPLKAALLEDFNIEWVPMSQEEFSSEILTELVEASQRGHQILEELSATLRRTQPLSDVTDLRAQEGPEPREFLLGREPTWADITDGYAVRSR